MGAHVKKLFGNYKKKDGLPNTNRLPQFGTLAIIGGWTPMAIWHTSILGMPARTACAIGIFAGCFLYAVWHDHNCLMTAEETVLLKPARSIVVGDTPIDAHVEQFMLRSGPDDKVNDLLEKSKIAEVDARFDRVKAPAGVSKKPLPASSLTDFFENNLGQ